MPWGWCSGLCRLCSTAGRRCGVPRASWGGSAQRQAKTRLPPWVDRCVWLLRMDWQLCCDPRSSAEDWVWMIDHSVQIGQCKMPGDLGCPAVRASRGPAAVPPRHGTDRLGADDEFDQADRGGVPGDRRGPDTAFRGRSSTIIADFHGAKTAHSFRAETPHFPGKSGAFSPILVGDFWESRRLAATLILAALGRVSLGAASCRAWKPPFAPSPRTFPARSPPFSI